MISDTKAPRRNQVVQRILSKCETTGVRLRSLALCIPQTWSRRETPIQEYLGPIFDRTVAAHAGPLEVTFALEAQCQAQHLISKHPRELSGCDELMVLDFGGHSMVIFHTPGLGIPQSLFFQANDLSNREALTASSTGALPMAGPGSMLRQEAISVSPAWI